MATLIERSSGQKETKTEVSQTNKQWLVTIIALAGILLTLIGLIVKMK
jgi:hypothetical protein